MEIQKKFEFSFPLKHLSNFWRTLDMPLINCEVNIILTSFKSYVLTNMTTRVAQGNNPVIAARTVATFTITDFLITIIFYAPVVTLSAQDDNKLVEQLKRGFKRTIKGNKYRSEMSNQTKNNNLNYFIDLTFSKVNRLFVILFENEDDRTSFTKYYTPKVKTKDFNILIDRKSFFDTPIKNKEQAYEQIIKMSRNNDYTRDNLLNSNYHSKHYKLTAIYLSKQIELDNSDLKQQINFIYRLEKDNTTMFFVT